MNNAQTLLEQLAALSRYYGSDPEMVLAGGGNTSVKDAGRVWVKASGTALADVDASRFVELERERIQALLDAEPPGDVDAREVFFKDAIMAARVEPERGQRPSVEAALHHLLPSVFVVHTHATLVNMLTCCEQGAAIAADLFGDDALWIPYVDPGLTLARLVRDELSRYAARTGRAYPRAVLMANHGLIICGDTPEEIRANTNAVLARVRERLEHAPPAPAAEGGGGPLALHPAGGGPFPFGAILRGLLSDTGGPLKIVTFDDSETVMSLVAAPDGEQTAMGGPLTPDQIVYCKSFPMWFAPEPEEAPESITDRLRAGIAVHRERTGFDPKVVLVAGLGMFTAGDTYAAATTTRQVYKDAIRVMDGARRLGGIRYLSQRDREFIDHWEVENYRRKVSAGAGAAGLAAGKVALVTGAAQGFGLGIAQSLAAEGAHVILADLNLEGAEAAAREIGPTAVAVRMNVTDADSIAAALNEVVRTYGGLDVLVSNAGVLRAGSVKTLAEKDFDFVTAVNYKGYFLCVRAVAPVMALQRLARPDLWADIIEVNSKSGLEGSNKNAAYAGSKFGGIGLTQSFALELIADGIKVNAVCPGNFFDGPLWSDPGNGLFAQYLRTGKVPGAQSIADVRAFYEAKVPMGRGCTVADVMKAIYYILEQDYETGQAVPVTGGQVMLN